MRLNVFAESFLELLMGVEQLGHDEVEQSSQLGHAVLDGSAC